MQHLRDLRQYVTDLDSISRLSPEETHQLFTQMADAQRAVLSVEQAKAAKQRLIESYLWLPVALVKRSAARLCTLSPLDLVQEGTLGLLRACDRFDFTAPGNFIAYASTTVRYAILNALPMENTIQLSHDFVWRNHTDERVEALRMSQPLSLDALRGEEEECTFADLLAAPPLVLPDPAAQDAQEEEAQQQTTRTQVEALLARLTLHEQQVLRLHYGLDEADGCVHSLTAIAEQIGLAYATVWRLEQQALRKLRVPQKAKEKKVDLSQTREQQRVTQQQRLETACVLLEAEGTPISVRVLARLAHVDKAVIRPFLRHYWEQQGNEQERLERACAALEAEGLPVTLALLCPRAHVGGQAAAAFLREHPPAVRPKPAHPAKVPPQERLRETYTRLVVRGEKITKARLRKEARVSTDTAGVFLRARRAGI